MEVVRAQEWRWILHVGERITVLRNQSLTALYESQLLGHGLDPLAERQNCSSCRFIVLDASVTTSLAVRPYCTAFACMLCGTLLLLPQRRKGRYVSEVLHLILILAK